MLPRTIFGTPQLNKSLNLSKVCLEKKGDMIEEFPQTSDVPWLAKDKVLGKLQQGDGEGNDEPDGGAAEAKETHQSEDSCRQ